MSFMDQAAVNMEKTRKLEDNLSIEKAIFDALHGEWQLSRRLQSYISDYPSGKLRGNAKFEKRSVTHGDFSNEYLYSEEGDFMTERSGTVKTRRQYVYRYQQEIDRLTVWFVKSDDNASVDYLFHCLDFQDESRDSWGSKGPGTDEMTVTSRGHHLCVDDDYTADYKFTFMGHELREWTVRYTVKGPRKDYVASSTYSLPEVEKYR